MYLVKGIMGWFCWFYGGKSLIVPSPKTPGGTNLMDYRSVSLGDYLTSDDESIHLSPLSHQRVHPYKFETVTRGRKKTTFDRNSSISSDVEQEQIESVIFPSSLVPDLEGGMKDDVLHEIESLLNNQKEHENLTFSDFDTNKLNMKTMIGKPELNLASEVSVLGTAGYVKCIPSNNIDDTDCTSIDEATLNGLGLSSHVIPVTADAKNVSSFQIREYGTTQNLFKNEKIESMKHHSTEHPTIFPTDLYQVTLKSPDIGSSLPNRSNPADMGVSDTFQLDMGLANTSEIKMEISNTLNPDLGSGFGNISISDMEVSDSLNSDLHYRRKSETGLSNNLGFSNASESDLGFSVTSELDLGFSNASAPALGFRNITESVLRFGNTSTDDMGFRKTLKSKFEYHETTNSIIECSHTSKPSLGFSNLSNIELGMKDTSVSQLGYCITTKHDPGFTFTSKPNFGMTDKIGQGQDEETKLRYLSAVCPTNNKQVILKYRD